MVTPTQAKINQKIIVLVVGILIGILLAVIYLKLMPTTPVQSNTGTNTQTNVLPVTSTTNNPSTSSAPKKIAAVGDSVVVDYVGRLDDGKLFDTSIESEAKAAGLYQTGRTYQPLSFQIGSKNLLPAFEAAIVGMNIGEKKTITIEAKDAYGEAVIERPIPAKAFQDVIDQEAPKTVFTDSVTQSVNPSDLKLTPDQVSKLTVGQTIDVQGTQVRYVGNSGSLITIEIPNTSNPFMGKKLEVGTKVELEGNTITIKGLTATGVLLRVDNKSNPFYGKKLAIGLKGKLADGSEIEIKTIDAENVTVLTKNTHPLAGKRLTFDLTLISIANPTK